MKWSALVLMLLVLPGCSWQAMAGKELISESIAIRHIVVQDDWVLVKKTGELHRRYIPGLGVGPLKVAKGNPELLAELNGTKNWLKPFDGKVTRSNKDIQVFGNYNKAVASGVKFKVAPGSQKYLPKKREAPEWWTKRLKEKD